MNTSSSLSRLLRTASAIGLLAVAVGCTMAADNQPVSTAATPADVAKQERVARLLRFCERLRNAGDMAVAVGMCGRAYEIDPENIEPLLELADTLGLMGRNQEAAEAYRRALTIEPGNIRAQFSLGKVHMTLQQYDLAMQQFESVLAQNDQNHRVYNVIGVVKDLQGEHKAAQSYYRSGLELAPGDRSLRSNLGLSLSLSGDHEGALTMLGGFANDPAAGATSRQNLALAYGLAGDSAAAESIGRIDLPADAVAQNLDFYNQRRQETRPEPPATVAPLSSTPPPAVDDRSPADPAPKGVAVAPAKPAAPPAAAAAEPIRARAPALKSSGTTLAAAAIRRETSPAPIAAASEPDASYLRTAAPSEPDASYLRTAAPSEPDASYLRTAAPSEPDASYLRTAAPSEPDASYLRTAVASPRMQLADPPTRVALAPAAAPPSTESADRVSVSPVGDRQVAPAANAETDQSVASAAAAGGEAQFSLKLGSYLDADRSRQAWRDIVAIAPDLLGEAEPVVQRADIGIDAGAFYRLGTTALGGKAQAEAVCAALLAKGVYCVIVPATPNRQEPAGTLSLTERMVAEAAEAPASPEPTKAAAGPSAAESTGLPTWTAGAEADEAPSPVADGVDPAAPMPVEPAAGAADEAASVPAQAAIQPGSDQPVAVENNGGLGALTRVAHTPSGAGRDLTGVQSKAPSANAIRYRLQLGAFRREAFAKRVWRQLESKAPDLLTDIDQFVERVDLGAEKGVYFRLRTAPMADRSAANGLCAELQGREIDCLVVRAPADTTPDAAGADQTAQPEVDSAAIGRAPIVNTAAADHDQAAVRYSVQFGAYRDAEALKQRWRQMKDLAPELLAGIEPVVQRTVISAAEGPYFRLRTEQLAGRDGAEGLCTALQARGVACVVVGLTTQDQPQLATDR